MMVVCYYCGKFFRFEDYLAHYNAEHRQLRMIAAGDRGIEEDNEKV